MTGIEENLFALYFKPSDFNLGPIERYIAHQVIDERDGDVTAKAVGVIMGTYDVRWEYCSKSIEDILSNIPGRAPSINNQKQAI
jgi:hypothetical protein